MNKPELAVTCFEEGFNCSQTVLSTFSPDYGLDQELALKVAGAFGSGMGRMGETCGAVTGAFMVIGLKHGKTRAEDEESKEKTYALLLEFVDKFKSRNDSIICKELLGCDLSTPEGMSYAEENNLASTKCTQYVKDAVEIIEQILGE